MENKELIAARGSSAETAGAEKGGPVEFTAGMIDEQGVALTQVPAMARRSQRGPARALLGKILRRRIQLGADGNFLRGGETANSFTRETLKW